jgi:uncharacterized protein YjbI with pentapeptide repeats
VKDKEAFARALSAHRKKSEDFAYFVFPVSAVFSGWVFDKRAEFFAATFLEDAVFVNTTFTRRADFGGVTFTKEARFVNTNFKEAVFFAEATFSRTADFRGAMFTGEVEFGMAKFTEKGSFCEAKFTEEASFFETTFARGADFSQVKFHKGADFERTRFAEGKVSFFICSFLDKTRFSPALNDNTPSPFVGGAEVDFRRVRIEPSDALMFIEMDLSKYRFTDTDLRSVRFRGVRWPQVSWGLGKRNAVFDETDLGNEAFASWAEIEDLYRQLKRNYEDQRDYERAGDFHYGEKEMRRQNPETSLGLKVVLWLYKSISGYGERWLPPIVWSLCLLLLGSAGYLYCGLRVAGRLLPFEWDMRHAIVDGVPMWIRSLIFSLRTMTLLRPDDMVPNGWGVVIQAVQSFLGPILIALGGFALRQRLRR